jgi:uncharacterized tellurite resistance protein B-like protein
LIDLIKKLMGGGSVSDSSAPAARGRGGAGNVHLAACAVFLEMAHIDNEFDERERDHILHVFETEYDLSPDDVVELKKASREALSRSKDYWKFTNVINQHFSNEEKFRLVELLWQLVYADGHMDEHENYLMHKLGKLLKMPHRDLIDAKLRVLRGAEETEEDE